MTLKEQLERYLRNNHGWIASGDLQRLVMENTSYTPQNVGRRIRELAEEGKLEVMYVRNHAHYRSAQNWRRNSAPGMGGTKSEQSCVSRLRLR